jgi:hypothetical protein
MFDNYFTDLKYEEYNGLGKTGQPSYKPSRFVKGLRLKGQLKFTTSSDGDTTSCSIVYKTSECIIPNSKLEGRTVMETVKTSGFGRDCGYQVYVK